MATRFKVSAPKKISFWYSKFKPKCTRGALRNSDDKSVTVPVSHLIGKYPRKNKFVLVFKWSIQGLFWKINNFSFWFFLKSEIQSILFQNVSLQSHFICLLWKHKIYESVWKRGWFQRFLNGTFGWIVFTTFSQRPTGSSIFDIFKPDLSH